MKTILETNLPLTLVQKGETCDLWEIDDKRLFMVATDRVSQGGRVMKEGVPGLGKIRNQLSSFWFQCFEKWNGVWRIQHHFVSDDITSIGLSQEDIEANDLIGRSMIIRKVEGVIPVGCNVRGYFAGGALQEYAVSKTVGGRTLVYTPEENERLRDPAFMLSLKGKDGSALELGRKEAVVLLSAWSWPGHEEGIGKETADLLVELLERASRAIYFIGSLYSSLRGLLVVDSTFSFGVIDDQVVVIGQVLTPDSSHLWDKKSYEKWWDAHHPKKIRPTVYSNNHHLPHDPNESVIMDSFWQESQKSNGNGNGNGEHKDGEDDSASLIIRPPDSLDKEFLCRWLQRQGWDERSDVPPMPREVAYEMRRRYEKVLQSLVSK